MNRENRPAESEEEARALTVLIALHGAKTTRRLRIPYRHLGWGGIALGLLVVAGCAIVLSWSRFAVQARRIPSMEAEILDLREQQSQLETLAQTLADVESAYDRLRGLFGGAMPEASADLWLPPPTGPSGGPARSDRASLPTAWPLTEAGFVTQTLLGNADVEHPGIDIAAPVGSYVRASGSGTVVEAGYDSIYGNFVSVDHESGYRTRYAHASLLLATPGEPVRQGEIIALTGSSGQSSAPHLHFEILQDGGFVDPLSVVLQP